MKVNYIITVIKAKYHQIIKLSGVTIWSQNALWFRLPEII